MEYDLINVNIFYILLMLFSYFIIVHTNRRPTVHFQVRCSLSQKIMSSFNSFVLFNPLMHNMGLNRPDSVFIFYIFARN